MKFVKSAWFTNPQYAMWLIVAIFLILYVSTAPRVNIGYADSDEFLAVGYSLGVAHPPGYPLYVLLLFIFTHLPIPGTVAFKGHLLSIVLSSLTLGIVFYTCWLLVDQVLKKKDAIINQVADKWLIAGLSTSLLGVSYLFWLYSQITEAFPLNNLFASLIILQVIRLLLQKPKVTLKQWLILASLSGLALSHHQTIILIFPIILVLLWNRKKELTIHSLVRMVVVGLLAFFLPFLLIYVYQAFQPAATWYVKPGLAGLVQLIFRREFSGTIVTTGQQTSAYLPPIKISQIIDMTPRYAQYLMSFFGIAALIAGVIGAQQWLTRHKSLGVIFVGGFLLAGVFFAGVVGWPENVGQQASAHRMWILGLMFIPFLLLAGWHEIFWRVQKVLTILGVKKLVTSSLIIIVSASILGWQLFSQYPLVKLRNFTIISEQFGEILDELKPNAMIACFSDVSCFALQYEQVVNNKRPDVIVLPQALPTARDRLLAQPELRGFVYPENPYVTYDYITWNIDKRPVYVVDLSEIYYRLLGIQESFTYYIPHGYYGELTRQMPEQLPEPNFSVADAYSRMDVSSQDRMRLWFEGNVIRTHIFNSIIYAKAGYREMAREELNKASSMQYELPEDFGNLENTRRSVEESEPDPNSEPGDTPLSVEEFLELAQQWYDQNRIEVAYKVILGAVTAHPRDVTARLALADAYERIGDIGLARIEYRNVLQLDPDNQTAAQKLEDLRVPQQN